MPVPHVRGGRGRRFSSMEWKVLQMSFRLDRQAPEPPNNDQEPYRFQPDTGREVRSSTDCSPARKSVARFRTPGGLWRIAAVELTRLRGARLLSPVRIASPASRMSQRRGSKLWLRP